MMKRILLAATALSVAFSGTMASAQDRYRDHGGEYQDQDRRGDRGDYRDDRREGRDYRDHRGDRRQYRDDRSGYSRGGYARYARGQRYRGDGTYFSDYRRYGYRAPPRGYRYYRTNDGDILLAAIATGIISSVIINQNRGFGDRGY